ncbi:hypothetical protein B7H23_07655 [Notoacmeibacter marinus]|uniref:Uncharacterized protein n=1 Tax=Notoacmeibacter marinus TaxID=1876515 RepID=A0A231V3I3_9HYPH|nr:hypothetical protein [Notoacmeibacter marinus]OXT02739.1 hypothetical protein B7H23_07655 [Notoacmeibacter marinus]
MNLRIVPSRKEIILRHSYDACTKFDVIKRFTAEYQRFLALDLRNAGRESFKEYVCSTIHSHLEVEKFVDAEGNIFDLDPEEDVTAETLKNLLTKKSDQVARIHDATIRIIHAFNSVVSGMNVGFNRPSFVETLGASTSMQYASPISVSDIDDTMKLFDDKIFIYKGSTSSFPASLDSECVLMWFRQLPAESFLYTRFIASPSALEFSHFLMTKADRSDWQDNHFTGVAVRTREGLSCHLASLNLRIPAYALIKIAETGGLTCALHSYQTPGYLLDYSEISPVEDDDVLEKFTHWPWKIL